MQELSAWYIGVVPKVLPPILCHALDVLLYQMLCYLFFWCASGHFRSSIQLGDKKISKRNDIMYSTVLGGQLGGLSEANLRLYHAAINIQTPPADASFQNIQRDLLLASEHVANNSMMKAKIGLESLVGINPLTNCVYAVVSYDGAYHVRSKKGGGGYSPYALIMQSQ